MKVYFGVRNPEGCKVFWWDTASPDRPNPLPMAQELWNHSPDGAEWGFAGSGPAQLALALLYHCTGHAEFAKDCHQALKWHLVAALPSEVWARTEMDILDCTARFAPTPLLREMAQALHGERLAQDRKAKGVDRG